MFANAIHMGTAARSAFTVSRCRVWRFRHPLTIIREGIANRQRRLCPNTCFGPQMPIPGAMCRSNSRNFHCVTQRRRPSPNRKRRIHIIYCRYSGEPSGC